MQYCLFQENMCQLRKQCIRRLLRLLKPYLPDMESTQLCLQCLRKYLPGSRYTHHSLQSRRPFQQDMQCILCRLRMRIAQANSPHMK